MSVAPETRVVASIVKAIKAMYPTSHVLKVHGSLFQATGFPDLLCVVDGRCYALEIKHVKAGETADEARERCSPRQRLIITELRKAGAVADVVTSAAEAIAVIEGGRLFFVPELFDPTPV